MERGKGKAQENLYSEWIFNVRKGSDDWRWFWYELEMMRKSFNGHHIVLPLLFIFLAVPGRLFIKYTRWSLLNNWRVFSNLSSRVFFQPLSVPLRSTTWRDDVGQIDQTHTTPCFVLLQTCSFLIKKFLLGLKFKSNITSSAPCALFACLVPRVLSPRIWSCTCSIYFPDCIIYERIIWFTLPGTKKNTIIIIFGGGFQQVPSIYYIPWCLLLFHKAKISLISDVCYFLIKGSSHIFGHANKRP